MLSLSVAMFLCMLPLQSWATKATSKGGLELSPKSDVHEINKRLRPRRIALVIGISKYRHSSWNDLQYPAKDARKMHRFLLQQGRFDEVMMLTRAAQTHKKAIFGAMQWLKQRVRSRRDTVLIYISGHGSIAQPRPRAPLERYLVVTDSNKSLPKTGISIRQFKALMEALPAQQKALILATCYVGQVSATEDAKSKTIASGVKGTYQLGTVSKTTLVLSAAGYMQPAFEVESLKGDVYTHFLLACAKTFDSQQKAATATMIHSCATKKTYQYVRRTLKREQTPSIESKIMGKDTFYLVRPPQYLASRTQHKKKTGYLKILHRTFQRVTFRSKGSKGIGDQPTFRSPGTKGSMTLRLKEGLYTIVLLKPDGKTLVKDIEIEAGSRQQLNSAGELSEEDDDDLDTIDPFFEGGGFISLLMDTELSSQRLFSMHTGVWMDVVNIGFTLGFGSGVDHNKQPIDDILLRVGIPLQLGYTFQVGQLDIYLNVLGEIGIWTAREVKQEIVFFLAYGPRVRLRWWFQPKVALRLAAGAMFTYSPDRALDIEAFLPEKLIWTHRFHFSVSIGFDFSAQPRY